MSKQTQKFLLGVYLAGAIATLVFQVAVRTQQCTGASTCAVSYGKAVVWAAIWPASWAVYLRVPVTNWLRANGYLPKGAA